MKFVFVNHYRSMFLLLNASYCAEISIAVLLNIAVFTDRFSAPGSAQTGSFYTSNANKINNYIPRFQKCACATLALAATMPIPERAPQQPSYNFEHMCSCKQCQKRHAWLNSGSRTLR
jgi:hypothetical protein